MSWMGWIAQDLSRNIKINVIKTKPMKIEELKRGDKIDVLFGDDVHKAKVLANYKKAKKIHIRLCGLWVMIKLLDDYDSYRFQLLD